MAVGSVLGNDTLLTPVLVAHFGREVAVSDVVTAAPAGSFARSFGGHARLNPALIDNVGCPHWAQNGLRRFQSNSDRASAYIAAGHSC